MKVSIIVFEINEIDGMRCVMPQIKPEWYDELIIVDGGSTDGTIEYAREHGYNLFVQKEKGLGAAFSEAIKKVNGDIVILFAPDGSFLPSCRQSLRSAAALGKSPRPELPSPADFRSA